MTTKHFYQRVLWLLVPLLTLFNLSVWGTDAVYTFSTSAGCSALGITYPSSDGSYTDLSNNTNYVVGQITMTVVHGTTNTRVYNSSETVRLRLYKDAQLTFAAASGYKITSVAFSNSVNNISASPTGSFSSTTWTAPSNTTSVTFTKSYTGNTANASITVVYESTASCSTNPSVGNASLNGTFNMTSTTSAIGVASGTCDAGTNCSWADYGFVWSDGANTTTPTVGGTNCNKVQVGTSGSATSWTGSVQPSGSTSPTSWTTGHTYYVRTYGKNSKASATYYYSATAYTFTPQSVTFKANGGTGSDKVQYMRKSTSTALTANTFTRSGYSFAGWATSSSGSVAYTDEQSVSIDADLVLHAKWSPEDYTITLDNQSATTAVSTSISVTFDASTNLSSTPAITVPEKTDYIFGGYYTETAGGGTQIIDANGDVVASASDASYTYTDASKNWKYPNNITLYAKWTEHTYTNYRTTCCDDPELAFTYTGVATAEELVRENKARLDAADEVVLTYTTSSSGTITDPTSASVYKLTTGGDGSGYGSRATTGGSGASAQVDAISIDKTNKKITLSIKNTNSNGTNTGCGTYRVELYQAAYNSGGDNYCEKTAYGFVDVKIKYEFIDAVNGNTTVIKYNTGSGVLFPTAGELSGGSNCHSETRVLKGWISETKLTNLYGSSTRVLTLDDVKDAANTIVAPGADGKGIYAQGTKWYAVWAYER